jgi:rare lipoprotein A
MASWYGRGFHGRKTASGEIYNMYALTAAHRTLPLGTYVRVHNLNNGKVVDVRINDRGPFVHRRIIDLSYKAAQQIGLVGPGTAAVEIVALGSVKGDEVGGKVQESLVPRDYSVGDFTVQVGAFTDEANAVRLRNKLASTHENAHIVVHKGPKGRTFYRVQVGKCQGLDKAKAYEKTLEDAGYVDAMVVAR